MKRPLHRAGFTLVELMAAMVAAAVLALTAGLMLFYAYKAWHQDRDGAAMQQDGCIAMELISRAVRGGSNVVIQATQPGDLRAVVSNRTLRIFAQGNNLIYDPAMSIASNEMTVVNGSLVSFAVSNVSGNVAFVLQMEAGDGNHRERLEGAYRCRSQ